MKEFTGLDQVWFVVSPQNPLKKKETLLADRDRLYLVELAIGDNDDLKALILNLNVLPILHYRHNGLLTEKYPQHKFVLVMGEDNLYTLHKWKNAIELAGRFPFYIYPRPEAAKKRNDLLDQILASAAIK